MSITYAQVNKVWTSGRAAGIAQMEQSLRLLRKQPLDLMQIHNLVDYATHLKTLREWKAAGRVRYIGATEMKRFDEVGSRRCRVTHDRFNTEDTKDTKSWPNNYSFSVLGVLCVERS